MSFPLARLVLVRHGETDWNTAGRLQGLSDSDLNETGRLQSRALAERLAGERVDALWTSPLLRAVETAEALAETLRLTPIVHHGLRERDVGTWGGLAYADVARRFPDEWERVQSGEDLPVGGGETKAAVQARMLEAIDVIGAAHAGGRVVVVSHGLALKTLVCGLLGLPLEQSERIGTLPNTGLTVFTSRRGRPVLERLGDAAHLASSVTNAR